MYDVLPEKTGIEVCYVEDDADLREATLDALIRQGFGARGFPGSREFYLGLLTQPCHIAILDVGLPGEDGFSIASNLRTSRPDLGIVMLTACGQVDDRVQGLQGGADAYLVKPVDMRELVAVLHSLARRMGAPTAGNAAAQSAGSAAGGWGLILDDWCLLAPGGTRVSLTPSERDLLRALMRIPDIPLSRDKLIEALGHDTEYYTPHRLDMLISRLRRKVFELVGAPLPLKALRGVGFAFVTSASGD